jgi:Na+/H+ antiporter NhaD/arsenite permease-like protein
MFILMVVVFVLGYVAIAMEHTIHVDKAASALLTGVITWTILVFGVSEVLNIETGMSVNAILDQGGELLKNLRHFLFENPSDDPTETPAILSHFVVHELRHHLIEISEILFFLLGAMTIVELIDAHEGFSVITKRIHTRNKVKLLWLLCVIAFFFSAALDNLTTAIVMAALIKKLIGDIKNQWLFGGIIVIAANAGGAWSPIGDVTTIMLWISGQVTAFNIIVSLFTPSVICMLVPLLIITFTMKGEVHPPEDVMPDGHVEPRKFEKNLVFILGVASLLFVPVFKTITHLPPFMGILIGLGFLWLVTEIMHKNKGRDEKVNRTVVGVIRRIDVPSVLFFLGILVAVGSLQSAGHLAMLAEFLDEYVGNIFVINLIIGVLSSIVDNVPLVAAAQGMYEIAPTGPYMVDGTFWKFLAYCAGTGGSCLIIGSAAGVAIMGILRIDFFWYLKKVSLLAFIGYIAGALFFILVN